jgi:ADP-L-glycero-D-manno-heptose 6-epimerase
MHWLLGKRHHFYPTAHRRRISFSKFQPQGIIQSMIIVTGAAGFIGSNIVALLNAQGRQDVVVVDDREPITARRQLSDLRYEVALEKSALPAWLEKNARSVESILHMGANSDTTASDRAFMMTNNLEYTRTLWNFCAREGKRFVYASSAATYGDGERGYDDNIDPKTLRPLNLYGESKHLFDLWALEEKNTPPGWAGLKFFNVYGPREDHKGRMASMAYHGFHQIQKTGLVKLFKSDRPGIPDGGQRRDFIYVKDAAAAVLHFARAPKEKAAGVYNVGTGQARSFADLIRAVFTALNREAKIEFVPMPEDLKGKYQYFTQATTAKLCASGFDAPLHSVEDGVRDYVVNHLSRA